MMKRLKPFKENNKGISSLFITIYIALIGILLISTLFVSISITDSSLSSYLRVEQARMQERIMISGPGALNVNDATSQIESIRVNNTGAIVARIRAIYINGKFICDPSKFSGDSYIAPQGAIWIDLTSVFPPITINSTTLNRNWTVTTERGTRSKNTGANLWLGSPNVTSDPNKFYFGPLLLFFNWFHWSNDDGSTWNEGWHIPKDVEGDIIWRILVANIDDRQIILSDTSTFALIQNSQQSNKICLWKLQSSLNPTTLELDPGNYYFLHFTPNPNPAPNISKQAVPIPVSSNFITLIGNFVEQNGVLTPFGQTIPFEAVIIV